MGKSSSKVKKISIYIDENEKYEGKPLYHVIILKARELGLAEATVLRGIEGLDNNNKISSTRILDISSNLPIVIDIIDHKEKIDLLLPFLDEAVGRGLVTIEEVDSIRYT